MKRVIIPFFASLTALLCACGGQQPRSQVRPTPTPAPRPQPPRLVVAIVLDQLGSHTLNAHFEHLDPEGAIRQAAERGAFHRRVRYPYAGTYTAAGHATLFTGRAPSKHGATANYVWDRDAERGVSIVDDGTHAVHGAETHASPGVLKAPTVADAVAEAGGGEARIVGLSYKDRGAIFGAGAAGDLAAWYDTKGSGFTTSTFYAKQRPAWLQAWKQAHPIEAALRPWEPGDPALLARAASADDAPGEGDWKGLGITFVHDPEKSEAPYSVFRATPAASERLIDLARGAVAEYGLGEDNVVDLLTLSISGTDYAGHVFGPDSWEYLDHLIRVDRALGRFLEELNARTRISVLITSDHGVAPLPEKARSEGHERATRLDPETLVEALDGAVDEAVGEGDWVDAYIPPYVYLSADARRSPEAARVTDLVVERLRSMPRIAGAWTLQRILAWDDPADAMQRAVHLSVHRDDPGDIFLVPNEYVVVEEGFVQAKGTTHGTPWTYDTDVPVLFWGEGVRHCETDNPFDARHIASTITALGGVQSPAADVDPLHCAPSWEPARATH